MAALASWLSNTEIILSLVSFLLLYLFRHYYQSHHHHHHQHLPLTFPVIGMLPGLLANLHRFHDWITDILRASCCNFMYKGPWFASMNYLFTSDPANINHIFNTNFINYPKGEDFSEIFDILGDGIFNADGESWRLQRKKAHNLMADRDFKAFSIKSSNSKVHDELIPLLRRLAGGEKEAQVVNLQDVFLRFTFDATCELVFGINPKSLSPEFPTIPFSKAMDEAMTVMFLRHIIPWWKLLRWLNVGQEKKLAKAWKVIDRFIAEAIEKKRDINHGNTRECDLLTSYIKDTDSTVDIQESNKILRDTTMNLMLAGRDTTGAALTWFFWLLSKNKQVEEKIIEEMKQCSLMEKKGGLESEELGKLVYLHAALCEALRLYPPVPFEHKGVVKPEVLPSGHKVAPGMKILVLTYAMGRMKGVWGEDCMEFKPERWISEKGKLRHEPSFKFLSFNAGPRTCLGKEVAFVQMKTVVAAMISRFHVDVVEDHVVEPKCSVILHMKNGLMVKIRERE